MDDRSSPYADLPPRNFWRTGVTEQSPLSVTDLYRKRFDLGPRTKIATAGSCFAQHISRYLRANGFSVLDVEPAPPGLPADRRAHYGYGLYSARYGNIYLTRQLRQLAEEMLGQFAPQAAVWEKDGRFFDALRPSVEPNGLGSPEEVAAHRQNHLGHVRDLLTSANVLVFTFGLTEGWVHRDSGTVYPTAPGTIAGRYDPAVFAFKNFTFNEILDDFLAFRALVRTINPRLRFLLTVSPVPLTATASDEHVLPATIYSKSVLRAVVGQLYQEHQDIDYFPSYELVASHFSRGFFYESNLRTVADAGVESVMRIFFAAHPPIGKRAKAPGELAQRRRRIAQDLALFGGKRGARRTEDVVCEESLLDAFGQ